MTNARQFTIRSALPCEGILKIYRKKRILVQYQGGFSFQTAGILKYVEDMKRKPNADIGPKGLFEEIVI
jgi:hypothetical protein